MKKYQLLKQTVGHFCVDAVCAMVVINGTQTIVDAVKFFILYNFLAFCLQPLAGIVLDKFKKIKYQHYIVTSFVFLLAGLMSPFNIWFRVFLVGIGNCLFHTGAGVLILKESENKLASLGIFVSSGAVGLFFGTIFADINTLHFIAVIVLVGLIVGNINLPDKKIIKKSALIHWKIAWLLCLCITIRSFMGFMPLTQFEKTEPVLFMITIGVFCGKYFGGILCDKFGINKVVLWSTAVVLLLFLFSFSNPYLWMFVQMIVNLSMPITLYLMYRAMPKYPAFSFGLAASFLVVGLLATFIVKEINIPAYYFLFLFIINSAIILSANKKLNKK